MRTMLNTVDSIANLLQGSFLENQEIRQLNIAESDQFAFAMEVGRADALEAWQLMRSHLETTRRYPILTEGWGSNDFFSRFYYKEEANDGKLQGTSPEAIIASVPSAYLNPFLEARKAFDAEYLHDSVDYSLERTKKQFGACPETLQIRDLMANHTIQSAVDLERWLFNWELQNFGEAAIAPSHLGYLDWFEPDTPTSTLLLLPTENSWEALAYIHWFGACAAGTTVVISLLKLWHQHYETELVCHYGTMLQFNVGKLPATPEQAFQLAWQQDAIAECTTSLPGVSLRNHARSLLAVNRWFLHERP